MEFDELFTKLKVNPLKLIESIVHADGSSVILFKNRKSEILYVNDQFYQKHPQFKNNKEAVIGKTDFDLFPDSQENATDALTQLYNRRFIHAELDTLHKEYLENNTPFSILLLDLDNFKSVNDNYGHHIGDEVIKHVGTVLNNIKHQKYPTMEPCRYGGDEFLVILPAYQKDGAVSIARDIKDAFDHVILHAGAYHDIVRLSIGVAGIRDEETIQDLLNKCDQRMYISKRDGKHRITY